jgi:hypothetical protein
MTKTFPTARDHDRKERLRKARFDSCYRAQLRDEFGALALGEPADRLRRRDPALIEDPVVFTGRTWDGQQHVDDLAV